MASRLLQLDVVSRVQSGGVSLIGVQVHFQPIGRRYAHHHILEKHLPIAALRGHLNTILILET